MAGPADNNIKSGGIDVEYVARLARISLSENERILFQGQLESIVGYVNDIAGVDVGSVPPAALAPAARNVLRPDLPETGLDREAVLKNAPANDGQAILVPKIVQ